MSLRALALTVLLLTPATLSGQELTPADTALPSHARVRFRSARGGAWIEAETARVFLDNGTPCLVVLSESIGGFVWLEQVDSLQIYWADDPAPAPVTGAPRPLWRALPVAALRAYERRRGCGTEADRPPN